MEGLHTYHALLASGQALLAEVQSEDIELDENNNPKPIEYEINGTSGSIKINHGDGTIDSYTLNATISHTYTKANAPYRIIITGDLKNITAILRLPRFNIKGLVFTPNAKNLSGRFNNWFGDIKYLKYTKDVERIVFSYTNLEGDISVFSQTNGKIGNNIVNHRFKKSQVYGNIDNFQYLHPDIQELVYNKTNVTGIPKKLLTLSNLSNITALPFSNTLISGFTGDINTNIQQSSIKEYSISYTSADLDTSLFEQSPFSDLELIRCRNLNSITGNSDFLSNTPNLEILWIDINIELSKLSNCEGLIKEIIVNSVSGSLNVFGNYSFANLSRIHAGNSTCTDDVGNLDLPSLDRLQIKNSSANGTLKFSNNIILKSIILDNNAISGFDKANSNFNLGNLTDFTLNNNALTQTAIEDIAAYLNDANLNQPGSNNTYTLDVAGAGNAIATSAAQTDLDNIANTYGWTVFYNS